ncbi:MAG TPA: hypothetical protein VGI82_13610 [Chitinophagaceae bacterium]
MKKIAAISLISLLLFNWYGYRFVTSYLQRKADRQLERRIDLNEYDESQLVEISVALDMPYQTEQSGFERHYGEININGKIYNYVKRKIENGYLVLECIPNTTKQAIKTADNILFNLNNGLDQEHSGSKNTSPLNNIAKSIFSDYDDFSFNLNLNIFSTPSKQFLLSAAGAFDNITLPVSEQPPETILSSLV